MSTERFKQVTEARKKALREPKRESQADAETRIQAQRNAWVNHGRNVLTAAGTMPDQRTIAARDAYLESKRAAATKAAIPPPTVQLSADDIWALENEFLRRNPSFYRSEFNLANLRNCMKTTVASGKLSWGIASFEIAAKWLAENNYLETPVRRRGEKAALEFPPYEEPEPEPQPVEPTAEELAEQRRIADTETRRLRSLSLDELRKEARKNYDYSERHTRTTYI